MTYYRSKLDATTVRVWTACDVVGQINYPGNDPDKNHHAFLMVPGEMSRDLGHFATEDDGILAIVEAHRAEKHSRLFAHTV